MTGQSELRVRETLVRAASRLSLEHLRKISVVCVADPERVAREGAGLLGVVEGEAGEEREAAGLSQMTSSQADLGMSLTSVCVCVCVCVFGEGWYAAFGWQNCLTLIQVYVFLCACIFGQNFHGCYILSIGVGNRCSSNIHCTCGYKFLVRLMFQKAMLHVSICMLELCRDEYVGCDDC